MLPKKGRKDELLRQRIDARDIAQAHQRPVGRIGAHDDVAELLRVAQATRGVDLHLEGRAGGGRRLADLAGGNLDVLLGDGVLHVHRRDAQIGKLVGIEPDTHRIATFTEDLNIADAWQSLERVDHLQIGVVAERHRIDRPVGRCQVDDQHEVHGFCFFMVTPPWLTMAGREDAACDTRFCTSTAAIESG